MRDDIIPIEYEVDFDRRPPVAQANPNPQAQDENQEQVQEAQQPAQEAA